MMKKKKKKEKKKKKTKCDILLEVLLHTSKEPFQPSHLLLWKLVERQREAFLLPAARLCVKHAFHI